VSGTVTDGNAPLGGVTVTLHTGGAVAASTITPTSGAVGTFTFTELVTPGTYLVSFEKDGYGTETVAVELGPGEARRDLSVALAGGTGTVTGTVTDTSGVGLGDVTVTVLGGATRSHTATLTSGQVGGWRVTGLPTPGDYAVTFSKPGYRSETVSVHLDPGGAATGVNVQLVPELGAITGVVRSGAAGNPGLAGADVVVTDGSNVRSTRSATTPTTGAYAFESLPATSYSVTFTAPGHEPRTVLVRLAPGERRTLDVELVPR
jgi:hypothetical protein